MPLTESKTKSDTKQCCSNCTGVGVEGHQQNGKKCCALVVCAFGVGILVVVGDGHEADGLVEALAALQRHLQQKGL